MRQTPFQKGVSGVSARLQRQTQAFFRVRCRSSSVVERIIGNDEVGSSILPCGTSPVEMSLRSARHGLGLTHKPPSQSLAGMEGDDFGSSGRQRSWHVNRDFFESDALFI